MIKTERLLLRPWRLTDAEDLYKLASDERIGPISGWPPHKDVDNSRKTIKHVLMKDGEFAIELLDQPGKVIGSIGLRLEKNSKKFDFMSIEDGELGFWIGVPYWGHGYAPEAVVGMLNYAFDDLNLNAVWCGYFDGNDQSHRVQEKCGFTYHHTEYEVYVPLLDAYKTEHFRCLTQEKWRNSETN